MEFYICEHCGNIIAMVKDKGVPVKCCGQNMTKLEPGTSDGAVEKHVPVFRVDNHLVTVTVGSVEHPMVDAHYIEWIAIKTAQGAQRKLLQPGDAPKAVFALTEDDALQEVYAYCNLHGLWKSEV
ncbi:MAG: desulfoferrodoxin [Parasporobacterium sp.]|nr:desulfoferrodoxin [Parasporobacterium sp.]